MVVGFADGSDRVAVVTEDGRDFEGAVLIGADGIRSRTRAQLFADGDPTPNGFMGFRTIVPMSDVTADVQRDVVALWGGQAIDATTPEGHALRPFPPGAARP
jgi:2-polyprenyl-6-methoxyphenol hydroxylase-like FAD-dependent oxidoreductase